MPLGKLGLLFLDIIYKFEIAIQLFLKDMMF